MYTVSDLERATGFTDDQIRDRLRLLEPIFGEEIQRGVRGKILVSDAVLAALRRLADLERQGLSPKVAVGQVMKELQNAGQNYQTTFGEGRGAPGTEALLRVIEELRQELAEVRKDRDHWRELALSLQERLLSLPALNPPREEAKKRWWQRLRSYFRTR